MMTSLFSVSFIALLMASFGASQICRCGLYQVNRPGTTYNLVPSYREQALNDVARSLSAFSGKFAKEMSRTESYSSVSSPFGIAMLLSLLAQGARGYTYNQMRDVLKLPSFNWNTLVGYQTIIDSLAHYRDVEIRVVNKIFLPCYIRPSPSFTDVATGSFRTEIESLDYGNSRCTSDVINDWCRRQTIGYINDVVTPAYFSTGTSIVLFSTVYLNGNWAKPFPRSATKLCNFYGLTTTKVLTMNAVNTYTYGSLPYRFDAKFVEIPYANYGISMFVILPNSKSYNGLRRVENNLDAITVNEIIRSGRSTRVNLYLPKITVPSTHQDLRETLQRMNVSRMFSGSDFSGIGGYPNMKVSRVVHSTFIRLEEVGPRHAAEPGWSVPSYMSPVTFRADHPFLMMVVVKSKNPFVLLTARFTGWYKME